MHQKQQQSDVDTEGGVFCIPIRGGRRVLAVVMVVVLVVMVMVGEGGICGGLWIRWGSFDEPSHAGHTPYLQRYE